MNLSRYLPRTIASRLYLILIAGLLLAHGLSFGFLFYERYTAASSMLLTNIEHDVITAVAVLDGTPPAEREQWLPQLKRRTYGYRLDAGDPGSPQLSARAKEMSGLIAAVLRPRYTAHAETVGSNPERFQVHLALSDGAPLTIEVTPSIMPIADWLPGVLVVQLALLLACTWLAVRLATRPLERLAHAAENLSPSGGGKPLDADGPVEVAKAVTAFNAMQDRIAQYLAERLRILAAISHDLQTPITRMKLRAEGMPASTVRDKLVDDLDEMEHLVREGVAYARSAHGATEAPVKLDLDAFLDSLVLDYQDTGKDVQLAAGTGAPVVTRPHALKRVVGNLVDNALKYAGAAEVAVDRGADGAIAVHVRDRGPGIPPEELDAVMQPFYRLEASRNRDTGGAGLGLAIAQQLAMSLGGALTLRNREGGGLEATLTLRSINA